MALSHHSISSQSFQKRTGKTHDNIEFDSNPVGTHNKYQSLTKLHILLKGDKKDQQINFEKISQQIALMTEQGLIQRENAVIAFIIIRHRLLRSN